MTQTATKPKVIVPRIRQTKLLIDGQWRDSVSGKTFPTLNPATEQVIAEVAEGDAEDIDRAVKAARRALKQGPWHDMDAADRGRLLYKLADLIEANQEELAALETLDNGKPIQESRTVDLPLVLNCFRYFAGWADKVHGQTIPVRGPFFTYTTREPVGVCGQIIPWNFPLWMVACKWAPALAAGCTVVLKPAEQTPLSALRLGELAMEAGFPPGVINIVNGFGPTAGAALVKHPLVNKITFTGEYKTAQIIMREAANTLKRVTFELGGKSPNIIFPDADLDEAIDNAFTGVFLNQGQSCCAGTRLFVHRDVHDEVVDRLAVKAKARRVGDPFDPATEQGPQVDQAQFDKIMHYIETGKQQGARCLTGGTRRGERGYFVEPTIFDNVQDDTAIAKDEIFGPVMSVLKFDDFEEVLSRANNTHYGLAAAIWTRDIDRAHALAKSIEAGSIWVNCYYALDVAAPFGGYKMSGIGRELGEEGIHAYTEVKTVAIHTPKPSHHIAYRV